MSCIGDTPVDNCIIKKAESANKDRNIIVLYFPQVIPQPFNGAPLGLLAAATLVDQAGFPVHIVSDNGYGDPLGQLKSVLPRALLVGISTMTGYQLKGAVSASKLVKSFAPEVPVVWGGWHPTVCPEQTIEQPYVDFVVRGQGELTLFELTSALKRSSNDFSEIPGLGWKKSSTRVLNGPRQLFYDESWPDIPLHLIDVEKHLRVTEVGDRVIDLFTSYGCPYDCTFCAENHFSKKRWVGMSAGKVLRQIRRLIERHRIDGVVFRDNNFFVNKSRALEIAAGIKSLPEPFAWGQCMGRTDTLLQYDDAEWDLLRESRLRSIFIGAESGLSESLKLINKKATVEQTLRLAEIADKKGIAIWYSFLAGYPWLSEKKPKSLKDAREKNREDFAATIDLVDSIARKGSNNRYLYFRYTPYPATKMAEYTEKLGIHVPDSLDEWSNYSLDLDNTTFLDRGVSRKLDVLQGFILPCLSNVSNDIASRTKGKFVKLMAGSLVKLFETLAWIRWRRKWFFGGPDRFLYCKLKRFYESRYLASAK